MINAATEVFSESEMSNCGWQMVYWVVERWRQRKVSEARWKMVDGLVESG